MAGDRLTELFFELFSGLPRQGPGDPESTRRALSWLPPLGPEARILDIGCGTGAQTLDLARSSAAVILAVDSHAPFVDELNAKAARLGIADRVHASVGDMKCLDFPPNHFDAIWSEGAIYNIGFDSGLEEWKRFLKPGGGLAISELCWLRSDPPVDCAGFFASEYPAMRDIAANRAAAERCRYLELGCFRLPDSAWWRDYYHPLERNLLLFQKRHPADPDAAAIAGQTQLEIEMFRRHSDYYGYVFFVLRKDDMEG